MNTSSQATRRSRLLLGFFALQIAAAYAVTTPLAGYELERTSEILISPEYISTDLLPPQQASNRGHSYLFINTRFSLTENRFTAEAQPELHWLQSTATLLDLERNASKFPKRFAKLEWNKGAETHSQISIGFERLGMIFNTSRGEISIGRRPVSLGVLNIFPVWNKFSRPLISDLGPLRAFSQDQISARFQKNEFAARAIDIEGDHQRDAARLAVVSWFGESAELHLLGGYWWKKAAYGLAGVKDFDGTSVKIEAIRFQDHSGQMGLGAERAFNDQWSIIFEALYLGEGATDKDKYLLAPPSRFCPLLARAYAYARIDFKPTPLWQIQWGDLANAMDQSQLLHSKIIYSLTNESDLDFEIRWPLGPARSEFSKDRAPLQALAGLRWVF